MPGPDKDAVLATMAGRYDGFYSQFTELKPLGGELRGACPLHGGTGANFAVAPDTGLWNCFSGCQDGGDVFRFLEKKEGVSFPDAVAEVAAFAGVTGAPYCPHTPRKPPAVASVPPPSDVYLDAEIAPALHDRLMKTSSMQLWLSEHRGLTAETLTKFQVGMQKDDQGMFRVTFPVLDGEGRLINIRRHLFAYKEGLDRTLKTLPWEKGLRAGLYPLSALAGQTEVLLVEGEADALLANQMGFPSVTGTGGAGTWKPEWTEALRGCQRVTILYDGDPPGRDGAQRAAAALVLVVPDVRIASLPDGEDFTSWVVDKGATAADVQATIDRAAPSVQEPGKVPNAARPEVKPAAQTTGPAPWEPPVPFSGHDLPAFPVEALPLSLAGMVTEVAASVQVAPEMPAMLALAVVAAASARRCLIRVGRTHSEPLNLFVAVTGEPGERKSAVVEVLAEPIRSREREMSAEGGKAQAAAQEARTVEEARLQQHRADAAKEKDAEKRNALIAQLGQDADALTVIPVLPRLLADDVTPEKLASMMAEQDGTMAILSAEGGLLDIIGGRYSDGKANMDVILKAHAGESVLVDRKGGASVHIPRARLTLGLAVQPDVLSSLTDTPAFRGRGLLGRFLYCLPQSKVGSRLYQNRPISTAAHAQYNAAILSILSMPPADPEDAGSLYALRLEGAALDTWAEHANEVERRQVPGADLSGIRDWGSKLAGAVARIAGGFHLVENSQDRQPWNTPVSVETVLAAWAVGQYLIPHAQAAFGLMGADPAIALARRLLAWIERGQQTEFSLRDCHRANRAVGSKALEPGLNLLCERGYLRLKRVPDRTGPGQPASPIYEVNPMGQNGQNTQK